MRERRGRAGRLGLRALAGGVGAAGLIGGLLALPATAAHAQSANTHRYQASAVLSAHRVGTVNLKRLSQNYAGRVAAAKSGASSSQAGRTVPMKLTPARQRALQSRSTTAPKALRAEGAATATSSITGNVAGESGFTGLTAPNSASVNVPYQGIPDVTPPDQGLAVGPSSAGTVEVELVNDALAIYNTRGQALLGSIPAYEVFGQSATAAMSDPRVYWDPGSHRWFLTMFDVGNSQNPTSTQFIDVSSTSDPFGTYATFSIDTTDSGQPNCPCFGDYDQIGADANGFYIATNEFGESSGYNGVILYALSKRQLEGDATSMSGSPRVVKYRVPTDIFGQAYHLSPASVPQYAHMPSTEYFVESNGDALYGRRLEVYALLDTSVLNSGGTPTLVSSPVGVNEYGQPPNATQKAGPIPLGQSVGDGEAQLQTDFDAVQEVTYTEGNLYAEYSTTVPYQGQQRSGADWVVLKPSVSGSSVSASVVNQGTLATSQNLLYPSIEVAYNGLGYMNFAVAGDSTYPTPAYAYVLGTRGVRGRVHQATPGTAPLDDFSCYPYFGFGTSCRYGDYSAGQSFDQRIYMATEYVGSVLRDNYTDWDTYMYSAPRP
jgi:hypothetical protein